MKKTRVLISMAIAVFLASLLYTGITDFNRQATEVMAQSLTTQYGYTARACGLDMNRNGIIGEAADCNVCDGVTTDPDSDGTDEDLNYIDAVSGTDDSNCGAPGSPCQTIPWVLAGSNNGYAKWADGAAGDPEDILCIKGTHLLTQQYTLWTETLFYDTDSTS